MSLELIYFKNSYPSCQVVVVGSTQVEKGEHCVCCSKRVQWKLEESGWGPRTATNAIVSEINPPLINVGFQFDPFLQLPLELRREVYSPHFRRNGWCRAEDGCYLEDAPGKSRRFELLMASKFIYGEALPVYMHGKRFTFRNVSLMAACLDTVGSYQRQYITHIWFEFHGERAAQSFPTTSGMRSSEAFSYRPLFLRSPSAAPKDRPT